MSITDIARSFGISPSALSHRIMKYGREKAIAMGPRRKSGWPVRVTHGHTSNFSTTPTYRTWTSMVQRCTNPARKCYRHYGGRGITVCERWMTFENFLADMGPRPAGLTLDRVNTNGHYEPGNCRWATWEQQCANRRARAKETKPRRRNVTRAM